MPGSARRARIAVAALMLAAANAVAAQEHDETALSSVGAPELGGAMDALFAAFAKDNPDIRKGPLWSHRTDSLAIGALMYQRADVAAMAREFDRNELAPYDHQFRGDMMKVPAMVPFALQHGKPVWLAANRRPGAPFAADVRRFLAFVLSDTGQTVVGRTAMFERLPAATLAAERAKLEGFIAPLDPAIPAYRAGKALRGQIASIGSDGMKSLMDRWMDAFGALHPGVTRGKRWEHPGTLNGFHALLAGLADLAPMGRELWPAEVAAYAAATGLERPVEIRVARGGFDTPQRTTAQAIFVHPANPVREISLPQLRAILAEPPSIIRWGQLGAGGDWAARPIRLYLPPPASPNAMSIQLSVLGGRPWAASARAGTIAETAKALLADRDGLAFGGMEEGAPGLKALAVAPAAGGPAIVPDHTSASSGRYPLTRYMYIRLTRKPGTALPAAQREFLRYILSRQGQSAIVASGYFPLTEAELSEERAKLD